MSLHTSLCMAASLAFAASALGAPAPSAPTVSEIVRRSVAANADDWKAQVQFGHREQQITKKLDSDGQTRSRQVKTYEVMMIAGSPYERLVRIDGRPLTPAQEQQERAKLNKEMARREAESPSARQQRISKFQKERADDRFLMEQIAKAFRFKLMGQQRVAGFDCWVLDAEPDPDYVPPAEKAKVLTGMRGRLYIEKEQYHWVRVEAEVMNPVQIGYFVAKVKPGTKFELDQAPVGNVWLPKRFAQSVNASVFGLYGMRSSEEDLYSDYHQTMLDAGVRDFRSAH